MRVVIVSDGYSEYVVPSEQMHQAFKEIADVEDASEEDIDVEYKVTFKNITLEEYETLPEFSGF